MTMIKKLLADPGFMFIGLLILALSTIASATVLPTYLEAKAREQCAYKLWPQSKEANMVTWCNFHGFKVNSQQPAQ